MESIEKEFMSYCIKVGKGWGLDALSSRLFGLLYLEPKEVSLEELSERTGYSLSSVSNKMKILDSFGMVQRIKKPGSRKVYFYMEKDVIKLSKMHFEKIYESEIKPAKTLMPELIRKYEKEDLNSEEQKKYTIIKNYHKNICAVEKVILQAIQALDDLT